MSRSSQSPRSPVPPTLRALGRKVPLPASPEKAALETFPNPYPDRDYTIRFDCPEFTALCPVTGQPDFGTITIEYVPNKRCIESKSLKLFLGSFRNHGSFAETITNMVRDEIVRACKPRRVTVNGDFTPRGGIGICVTASYPK